MINIMYALVVNRLLVMLSIICLPEATLDAASRDGK